MHVTLDDGYGATRLTCRPATDTAEAPDMRAPADRPAITGAVTGAVTGGECLAELVLGEESLQLLPQQEREFLVEVRAVKAALYTNLSCY
jgi:hypothetical protein